MVTKKRLIFSLFSLIFASSMYWAPLIWRQAHTFYKGYTFMPELGHEKSSPEVQALVQQALRQMDVPFWYLMQIKKGNGTSCSYVWHIWMNENEHFGPIEYVAYHEAAHVALGHCMKSYLYGTDQQQDYAKEIQADLLAAETLYNAGKKEVIFERLAYLQLAVDKGCEQNDLEDHPSLAQMVRYFTRFLVSKGHTNVDQEVKNRMKKLTIKKT